MKEDENSQQPTSSHDHHVVDNVPERLELTEGTEDEVSINPPNETFSTTYRLQQNTAETRIPTAEGAADKLGKRKDMELTQSTAPPSKKTEDAAMTSNERLHNDLFIELVHQKLEGLGRGERGKHSSRAISELAGHVQLIMECNPEKFPDKFIDYILMLNDALEARNVVIRRLLGGAESHGLDQSFPPMPLHCDSRVSWEDLRQYIVETIGLEHTEPVAQLGSCGTTFWGRLLMVTSRTLSSVSI